MHIVARYDAKIEDGIVVGMTEEYQCIFCPHHVKVWIE
jgi:hypothetical protein